MEDIQKQDAIICYPDNTSTTVSAPISIPKKINIIDLSTWNKAA
jgi:hypothetical protein